MVRKITLSAEAALIDLARQMALEQNTTLNALFRRWLVEFAEHKTTRKEFDDQMDRLDYVKIAQRYSRDEMNER